MGRLEISVSDHNMIRNMPEVQAAVADLAAEVAGRAVEIASAVLAETVNPDAYKHGDVTKGSDRCRAHVWAVTGQAIHAERRDSPLLQIVGQAGVVQHDRDS